MGSGGGAEGKVTDTQFGGRRMDSVIFKLELQV